MGRGADIAGAGHNTFTVMCISHVGISNKCKIITEFYRYTWGNGQTYSWSWRQYFHGYMYNTSHLKSLLSPLLFIKN